MGARLGRLCRAGLVAGAAGLSLLWLAVVLVPFDEGLLARPLSTVVTDKDGAWLDVELAADQRWRVAHQAADIPDHLVDAIVSYEDKRFFLHAGIDPIAILRATWANLTAGHVVSGGSTLTMQVARMMDPGPRTLGNKLVEAFRALQLEWRYDKREILHLYFSLAPYGGNIEGVATAARGYFQKPLARLDLDEAALLAVVPNAPTRLRPDRAPDELQRRRNMLLDRMHERGLLTAGAAADAKAVPLAARPFSLPRGVLHVLARGKAHHRDPASGVIATTLDRRWQALAERHLHDHIQQLKAVGIDNGAVVIVDNRTSEVRAYVGSADFWDRAAHGQVDGAMGERSPGSTLKPFLYARGLDRGLIGLSTLVPDVPVDYSGYQPENYDGLYRGLVPAKDALATSLNIPAVLLEERLQKHGLLSLLREARLSTFSDPGRGYGLSVVIGGCEVTLRELTALYSSLARGGQYRPARLFADVPTPRDTRLFSPEAAYLISEVLTEVKRPDMPEVWKSRRDVPQVAWKTGTSYGHRDAWSVGYTRDVTVGVWVGHMNGRGTPALVGSQAAAPLLFHIVNALPSEVSEQWLERPAAVIERTVCARSGALPEPFCPHTKQELAIQDVAPIERCRLHQELLLDVHTGHRLCSHCRQGKQTRTDVRVVWPPEVASWVRAQGIEDADVPPHEETCTQPAAGPGPTIKTPQDGDRFLLREGVAIEDQSIPLAADAHAGTGTLFWFVDGRLFKSAAPTAQVLLPPRAGAHEVVVIDDEGRSHRVRIHVETDLL